MTPRTRSRERANARSTRRWLALLAGLALLLLAPFVARAQGAGADSVTLSWTAPGDDGAVGTAAAYEVRMSTASIDAANWSGATVVTGAPAPAVAGSMQSMVVRGLTRGTTYWFAIKARDESSNWSGISNVLRHDWTFDGAPPAAPTGTLATRVGSDVHVTWAPNAEADLAGYQLHRGSSAAFVPGPSNLVATLEATDFVDAVGQPCFYKLAAVDAHGNQSAFTLLLPNGTADVAPAAEPVALALAMPAPNPARTEATLRFSLSRAGAVRLAVHDVSGRRVRTLIAGHRAAGAQEARWDLRGADGAPVAAGLYFVRLEAEGLTLGKRLVVTD